MAATDIIIRGAREHNLRGVDVTLPRNQLICLTGVSGSGKSSLAFDTLYAEGQRRYIESLSSFARQFLGQMPKPEVDHISGLSPSISISQKSRGSNPRSTVGTITEIYDFLRVLFARVGIGHCPQCGGVITGQGREQILDRILMLPEGSRFQVLAPIVRAQKGEFRDLFEDLLKQGFVRARVDGNMMRLTEPQQLDRQMRHNIEVVIDRLVASSEVRPRLAEAVDMAMRLAEGDVIVSPDDEGKRPEKAEKAPARPVDEEDLDAGDDSDAQETKAKAEKRRIAPGKLAGDLHLSSRYACVPCGISFEPPSPQLFSFNSPQGMCRECDGLGEVYSFDTKLLVPDPAKSFKDGAIDLIGPWHEMGRWKRHIYQGVADTLEHKHQIDGGTILETPWRDLDPELQKLMLFGTGDLHITYTWRNGAHGQKYGGKYEGIVPELLTRHRNSKSKMHQRQLEAFMTVIPCASCGGERLNKQARAVTIASKHPRFADKPALTLPDVCDLAINEAVDFFSELSLDATGTLIAGEVLKEVSGRLGFLLNVGLEYLTLARTAPTLSGGESQRIRLAGQVGCGLVGVTYILDEPSIGLHPRDNDRLIETLLRLRDMGNTVVVVEHDEQTIRVADKVIDFGPGPGVRGGYVVASGKVEDVAKCKESFTGQYLSGTRKIEIPEVWRPPTDKRIKISGATCNNLKNIDVEFPLGVFICVTGVSGSGKSSLVGDILSEVLHRDLNKGDGDPGAHTSIEGMEHLDKLISIDQTPIGRTPRSNPSTYVKVFDDIRKLYTQLPESKARGYQPGRFSFNVEGGRCEACEGNGSNKLEMDFLADVWVTCPVCNGHRFNRETLQVRFKGKSIADVLEMDIQEALVHFSEIVPIAEKLQTLHDVGLDYLKLGQASPTLSGGEAQRIKLARELVKKSTGRTLYLLDEPTTGLHFEDIRKLLEVLQGFAAAGNTVLVVEHNLDVIKTADWVIDLGPEGGAAGGRLVACGTPADVAEVEESYTGRALAEVLGSRLGPLAQSRNGKHSKKVVKKPRPRVESLTSIKVQGARQHNLKGIDVEIPRDQMTVCCGMSGSGKTSLAMDTIYAEGQRRYVESLSAYARQFVGQMQKPKLDHISGLSPAIAIEQKNLANTPRSTVGTVTEVYDYLRVLYARLGQPYCPACDIPIGTQTTDEIVDRVLAFEAGTKMYLLAPLEVPVGEKHENIWRDARAAGYVRIRVDGTTYSLDEPPTIDRRKKHQIEILVDRISVKAESRSRIAQSVETALNLGRGVMHVAVVEEDTLEPKWQTEIFSQHLACEKCGRSFERLNPHNFSFNSSLGWCLACEGLGTQTGANPAALLRDPKLSLAEGAVLLWPGVERPLAKTMLSALSTATGVPIDVPYDSLSLKHRRVVLHGTGDTWIEVHAEDALPTAKGKKRARNSRPLFRFQYKGLYPALDEACRLAPGLRAALDHLVDEVDCSVCGGSRLRDDAGAMRFGDKTVDQICRMPLENTLAFFEELKMDDRSRKIAGELIREISNRLRFLVDVGLEYLTINRSAPTLSGGEAQRIRLASQIGSGLTGVLYVLDEPTIGLHPRDNLRLIKALKNLRDLGNTLLLVEHDKEVVAGADQLLDFGPRAGDHGGQIVARGTPAQVAKNKNSVTGPYLSGKKSIAVPSNRRMMSMAEANSKPAAKAAPAKKTTKGKVGAKSATATLEAPSVKSVTHASSAQAILPPAPAGWLKIQGARHNNLRNVDVGIPLGTFSAITGVSGSGKSSLIEDVLYKALARQLHRARTIPGAHDGIVGLEQINKVIRVDQQPLGNSPSSNPATFTGVFDLIRDLFSQLPESKLRGYTSRRFSFNVPGGRCEACEGNGQKLIEMHFLPDVWVECDVCRGQRYNPETLAVRYREKNIAEVLDMPCGRALEVFENLPKIRRTLQTLCDVGLDYVRLGQPAPTLSGGEAQRVKLAAELSRPDTGRTLYLLDEPTTGLHFEDLAKLLEVLNRLVDLGNTVVVIEHNLDVIKTADWVVDLGPEAGEGGGRIVCRGTPEDIAAHAQAAAKKTSTNGDEPLLRSYTGEMLVDVLAAGPHKRRERYDFAAELSQRDGDLDIRDVGVEVNMPWEADGRKWHTRDRVGRKGEPCRWDGEILSRVIDKIHELGEFSPTDWNSRTVVEISAAKKSDGWFFHASTGHEWLLTFKFRTARNTFKANDLIEKIGLVPLNDLPDLPVYGTDPRVVCKNLRGPWQEVSMRVHSLEEIDRPAFWKFIEQAVAGFTKFSEKKALNPEDLMPWKVLGRKWHFSRKGFPPGKVPAWETDVLEDLCEMLVAAAPKGTFLWNNQQVVHLMVSPLRDPWATVYTKRREAVELILNGPKGKFALGRIAALGQERQIGIEKDREQVKIKFTQREDLAKGDLAAFLAEHVKAVAGG